MNVSFKKLRPEAIVPYQKDPQSAGWDLATPDAVTLKAGERKLFPLGIAAEFPDGYVALFRDRSSFGAKGIQVLAGVVDASYRGEWTVVLLNTSNLNYTIAAGDRIAQCLFFPIAPANVEEVQALSDTARGAGGFGSSGR